MRRDVDPSEVGFTGVLPVTGPEAEKRHKPIYHFSRSLSIAHHYSRSFEWTRRTLGFWEGLIVPDLVGVFLYRVAPPNPDIPEWHWFVVGTNWPYPDYDETDWTDRNEGVRNAYAGLPNAYIWSGAPEFDGGDSAQNPARALESYVGVMGEWVGAALRGDALNDYFPVDVPSSLTAMQYAKAVKEKLQVVTNDVLPKYDERFRACGDRVAS